jgi:hypothetical protein
LKARPIHRVNYGVASVGGGPETSPFEIQNKGGGIKSIESLCSYSNNPLSILNFAPGQTPQNFSSSSIGEQIIPIVEKTAHLEEEKPIK